MYKHIPNFGELNWKEYVLEMFDPSVVFDDDFDRKNAMALYGPITGRFMQNVRDEMPASNDVSNLCNQALNCNASTPDEIVQIELKNAVAIYVKNAISPKRANRL